MSGAGLPHIATAVVDFDGTICPQDVSEEILAEFAPPEWWDVDLEFQRGRIGSRACLTRQAAMLEGRVSDMIAFAVERFPLEPTFAPFAAWASSHDVEVVVASDGMGFYIEPMLRAGGVEGITVLTNDVTPPAGRRPARFVFPSAHPVCMGCGTCKMAIVESWRRREGPVAFVGEGHTDRYGALYADLVFAKKHLPEICRSDGVPFLPWETFDDVRRGIQEVRGLPPRVAPDRCPGWTTTDGGLTTRD